MTKAERATRNGANGWWTAREVGMLFHKTAKTISRWIAGCPPEIQRLVHRVGGRNAMRMPMRVITWLSNYHCVRADWSVLANL